MSKKVTVQIEADDDGDMRVNTLLDEAFAGPSSPAPSPLSGSALRNNPELEAAFADLFEKAAATAARTATQSPAGSGAAADPAAGWRGRPPAAPPDPFDPADVTAAKPNPENLRTAYGQMRGGKDWRDQWENDQLRTGLQDREAAARRKEEEALGREAVRLGERQQKEEAAWKQQRADDARKRMEEIDAASRQRGNTVYGYGSLARSVTQGGLNSGSGVAQGLAQLNSAGALGATGAGFGPMAMGIGAAVDAGTGLIKTAFERMRTAVEDGGKAVKQIASNDGLGLMQTAGEQVAKSFEAIPVAGGLVASGFRALVAPIGLFQTAMEAFTGRAKELSQYNGEIAVAKAIADMNQTFADMKEANQQGNRYAQLLLREQEMNQRFQEAFAPIKAVLVETLADVAELIAMFVEGLGIGKNVESGVTSLVAAIPVVGESLAQMLKLNRQMRDLLRKDSLNKDDFLGDLDRMMDKLALIPQPGAGVKIAPFDRANAIPFFFNPPRL